MLAIIAIVLFQEEQSRLGFHHILFSVRVIRDIMSLAIRYIVSVSYQAILIAIFVILDFQDQTEIGLAIILVYTYDRVLACRGV